MIKHLNIKNLPNMIKFLLMLEEIKKTRKHFSNKFKRKVFLEYIKGRKPVQILTDFRVNLTEDKKYAVKLIHKWKNELYKNMGQLNLNYMNIDFDYAKTEIDFIGDDSEKDNILDELLTKNNKNSTL